MEFNLNLYIGTICCILLIGCADLISLDAPETTSQLVVDGAVNNLDDGNWINLTTSTPGLGAVGENTLGQNATVSLINGDEAYTYEEMSPGNYFLSPGEFQGQIGEAYFLRIITANSRTYESQEVIIPEPVEVADTRAELVELVSETDEGLASIEYFHDVIAEMNNASEAQFIKIDNKGMAEVFVDYEIPLCGLGLELPRGPAAGLSCWSILDPISRDVQLATNVGLAAVERYETLGVRVPFQFRSRYVTTLLVHNMSASSFNFWEKVQRQLQNTGGPFDPPVAPLPGNIRNIENDEEIVLGFFHAYGTTLVNTCFDRFDVPENSEIPIIPPPCEMTCAEFWAPATSESPAGLEQCPL